MEEKGSILIVDDESGLRDSLTDILMELGYHPLAVGSGKDALEKLTADFDVALIDIRLGDITGIDVLREIKKLTPQTECIVMTGFGSQDSAIEAINLGAYSYVLKPYDVNNLIVTITRALEKRRTTAQLRRSEEKYKELYNKSPDMYISITGDDGKILVCNETFLHMTGYTSEEVIGIPFLSLFHHSRINEEKQTVASFMKDGDVHNKERILVKKDGSKIDVSVNLLTVQGSQGQATRCMLSLRDISELTKAQHEQKLLQEKIQQSQKMEAIGTLAGGIAHDFNNILCSMIGFTELALEDAPQGSEQEDNLLEVKSSGMRASDLVQQILAVARQSDLEIQPVNPASIIADVLKLLRPSTPTNIEIKTSLSNESWIKGNKSQIHQVIMNLCTNSVQAMVNRGGVLEIELCTAALAATQLHEYGLKGTEFIELTVKDNGPGIEPSKMQYIFEPYFTTKDVGEGTGLGLAMVKGIVESYGGYIEARSEPDRYTNFRILLPTITHEHVPGGSNTSTGQHGIGHILFIDDEISLTKMGSRILESLGYTVSTTTSSRDGLELFKADPAGYDLVISDITMPFLTGDELAIELRKIREDIPILLCTGYSSKVSEKSAREIGVDAFVYKPYSNIELSQVVSKILTG